MATIPTKVTLADKTIEEIVYPEQEILSKTVKTHTVAEKTIAAHKEFPNKNLKLQGMTSGDTVLVKVSINGGADSDIFQYKVPTIADENTGDVVLNFRYKEYVTPIDEI